MWLGDDLWVESWIDEEELGSVRVGSEATVTFHALPGQEFSGTVERIGLATDLEIPEEEVPQPRFSRMRGAPVVGVRIRLDDQPSNLMPGLSAVVAIRREG
jgi:multidrug resistance efflux pump